jgi:CheY-like chemotaxis protein
MEQVVVALSADMIFAVRIRSAAESAGVSIILAKNVEDFLTRVRELKPRLAILDMDRRGLDVSEVVSQVKAENVELLAYVSHVREDLINAARAAGADRVMARGAFAKNIAELLRPA